MTHIRVVLVKVLKGRFKLFQLGGCNVCMRSRDHLSVSVEQSLPRMSRTTHLILDKGNLFPDVCLGQF